VRITILGSGTSHGIPVIGCDCAVCRSGDRRDRRRRASIYVEGEAGERFVVDTGCDFRAQALSAGIHRLDAVFLTHAHADHLHGLDDLRPLTWDGPLPVYANRETLADLCERFAYVFKETQRGGGKPNLAPQVIDAPRTLAGITVTPLAVKHGALDVLGYVFTEAGISAAYITDCSQLPAAACARVQTCDTLVIGALREKEHPTHYNFSQVFALLAALCTTGGDCRLRRVYFTHISHETSHADIEKRAAAWLAASSLPLLSIAPGSDMLRLDIGHADGAPHPSPAGFGYFYG
jgi:phosphoribosyl 1,2-cyclic phosphate phosphodiesterase